MPFVYPVELWDHKISGQTIVLIRVSELGVVDSVMVGGRFAVRHRKLVHVDIADLKRKAEAAKDNLMAHTKDRRDLFDKALPIVNSFCPAVAHQHYHVERYAQPSSP